MHSLCPIDRANKFEGMLGDKFFLYPMDEIVELQSKCLLRWCHFLDDCMHLDEEL